MVQAGAQAGGFRAPSALSAIVLLLLGVEEHLAHIGAVNAGVAACTRLARRRVAMRGNGRLARRRVQRRRMALQADGVHIGARQQFRICSTVRKVTRSATFRLDRGVLINERSGHSGVAFCAYIELPGGSAALTLSIGVMRIVAIGALDHASRNVVLEGHGELRPDVIVALIAQFRLRQPEQMLRRAGAMNAMTTDAAYISLAVR